MRRFWYFIAEVLCNNASIGRFTFVIWHTTELFPLLNAETATITRLMENKVIEKTENLEFKVLITSQFEISESNYEDYAEEMQL